MGFQEAVKKCLRDWITFSGRAPRSEYWWFVLFYILVLFVFGLVFYLLGGAGLMSGGGAGVILLVFGLLVAVVYLFLMIAGISAVVRRLHDRNMSGWWYGGLFLLNILSGIVSASAPGGAFALLLSVLVLIASIALLVIMCLRGTHGPNRYGNDPLGGEGVADVFE